MSRTIFKAKTCKVNRAAPSASSSDASAYCTIWTTGRVPGRGWKRPAARGRMVACLRPFIEHLASSSLSPKTIRRHVDNLWMLGGEIIRDLNYTLL